MNSLDIAVTVAVALSLVHNNEATTCARRLTANDGWIVSYDYPTQTSEIPNIYKESVTNKGDCIFFMDMNWDDDAIIQFYPIRAFLFQQPSPPSVQIIAIEEGTDKSTENNWQLTETLSIQVTGTTTRSFAIVFNVNFATISPFAFYVSVARTRSLACPDLASNFDSVSCSNGNGFGSVCKFKCADDLYPSPDLFNPNIQSNHLNAFRSSNDPTFTSTCSLTDRRRPVWFPEVLTEESSDFGYDWKNMTHHWKCVGTNVVREVCLEPDRQSRQNSSVQYQGLFETKEFSFTSVKDCYYPMKYLLSIFEEDREVLVATAGASRRSLLILTPLHGCPYYCQYHAASQSFQPPCGNYSGDTLQINCLTCRWYTGCIVQEP